MKTASKRETIQIRFTIILSDLMTGCANKKINYVGLR
jgi:hypothetical protein